MIKNNGGPAFPCEQHETQNGEWNQTFEPGMSLRDYFAAKAIEAILRQLDRGVRPEDCIRAAEDAYFMADMMLKAREA